MTTQETVRLSLEEVSSLCSRVLLAVGLAPADARSVAEALTAAERDGIPSHGVSRLPFYVGQVQSGKINAAAKPKVVEARGTWQLIDAERGFAFPAIDLAIEEVRKSAANGLGGAGVMHSHHLGVVGHHAEKLATYGLIAVVLSNTPGAIAAPGGRLPLLGNNPLACAFPRAGDAEPLVIDLAPAKSARGKVMLAAKGDGVIPKGIALGPNGEPTTSAEAALRGSMVAIGEQKGAVLAMLVELLVTLVTGCNFAYEATSFFEPEGKAPEVGHVVLAFSPSFSASLRLLDFEARLREDGVQRLPGDRRLEHRSKSIAEGILLRRDLADWLRYVQP